MRVEEQRPALLACEGACNAGVTPDWYEHAGRLHHTPHRFVRRLLASAASATQADNYYRLIYVCETCKNERQFGLEATGGTSDTRPPDGQA